MMDTLIFWGLCFFTLGFLCLLSVISFFLNYYFTAKVYRYYFAYITTVALFIMAVFIVHSNLYTRESQLYKIAIWSYEALQVVIFLLYTYFIYNALLLEGIRFGKFEKIMRWYGLVALFYILFSLFYSEISKTGTRTHLSSYIISRIIIVGISFVFYFRLIKGLSNTYFRYIFIGCTLLLIFALLALWDSTLNRDHSNLKGFQFICIGYVLENLCFSAAFVYRIITVYREKQATDINHAKQLVLVELESQRQTMKHIGAEIHDNVGQKLTLASIYTNQFIANNDYTSKMEKINSVGSIINDSLNELRRLSKSLINNDTLDMSLVDLLQKEATDINATSFCHLIILSDKFDIDLPQTEKNILFRLLQEFLQNSLKHSKCRKIEISLDKKDEQLLITATDDGKGFDTSSSSTGIGLQNMQRRAEQINAVYKLSSESGKGTTLTLQVPITK